MLQFDKGECLLVLFLFFLTQDCIPLPKLTKYESDCKYSSIFAAKFRDLIQFSQLL